MPHISVKCFPRDLTEDQKTALSEALCDVLKQHLGTTDTALSVALEQIPKDEWKTRVYDAEIKPNLETLLKKPGYEY